MYYLYNGHGDVTGLADTTGNITKTYNYDAFGVELNQDIRDTNPFRYCGQYYDKETDSIYLRARYYNPVLGRFTTEDPAKDGLNWYVYCGNNPVMFIDPIGLKLMLNGDEESQNEILKQLQKLTDNKLKLENGEVTISEYAKKEKLKSGNKLIKKLIDSEKVCSINLKETDNYISSARLYSRDDIENISNGEGADCYINFHINTELTVEVINPDTKLLESQKRPSYIRLAHELIHAEHFMSGTSYGFTEKSKYIFVSGRTKISGIGLFYNFSWEINSKEELATVGLLTYGNHEITENMIRSEHNLWLRGRY